MFPVEKKADWRRKNVNRAIRPSDSFSARYEIGCELSTVDKLRAVKDTAELKSLGVGGGEGGEGSARVKKVWM